MNLTILRGGLIRITLGALLMAGGIACGATDEPAVPPIANPGTLGTPGRPIPTTTTTTVYGISAADVVDEMGAEAVEAYCLLVDTYRYELGWTDSEMFTAFAEGYGDPGAGLPSARSVWIEFLTRCPS